LIQDQVYAKAVDPEPDRARKKTKQEKNRRSQGTKDLKKVKDQVDLEEENRKERR
jgi:hypothetical protein